MATNPYEAYGLAEKQAAVTELVSILRCCSPAEAIFEEILRRLEILTPPTPETRALLGEQEKAWMREIEIEFPELRGTPNMERLHQLSICPMPQYQSFWGM